MMKKINGHINYFLNTYAEKIVEAIIVIALLECVIFSFIDDYVSVDLVRDIRINFLVVLDAIYIIFRAIDTETPLKRLEKINIIGMIILLIIPWLGIFGIIKP